MKWLGLGKFVSSITGFTNSVGSIIDKSSTTDEEKLEMKRKLSDLAIQAELQVLNLKSEVTKLELQGNWLQRSWRPIAMLALLACIIGLYIAGQPVDAALIDTFKLGLGGYIAGRSLEKVTTSVTQNLDLSVLKKKDRADKYK